jgi:hypothetical protein
VFRLEGTIQNPGDARTGEFHDRLGIAESQASDAGGGSLDAGLIEAAPDGF